MIDERIKITKSYYDNIPSYTIVVETKYKILIEIDTSDNSRINISATGPMTLDEAELVASALSIAIDLAKKEN